MSVLTDWEIEQQLDYGHLVVTPLDKSLINPASLDCRLGGNFSIIEGTCINPLDRNSFHTLSVGDNSYILPPKGSCIASLLEDITLPDNVCAKLFGKSSLARLGLDNSSAGAWIDNGFSGVITIELFNQSDSPILLTKGMKIGQLIFYKTERCAKPYGSEGVGRYQRQSPGAGSLGIE